MDGSEPVTIRFRFDDNMAPRWTVTIGEADDAPSGEGDSLTAASWEAQMAKRKAEDARHAEWSSERKA